MVLHHDEDDTLGRGGQDGAGSKQETGGCDNCEGDGAYDHSGILGTRQSVDDAWNSGAE
jgi:hypothetical protein